MDTKKSIKKYFFSKLFFIYFISSRILITIPRKTKNMISSQTKRIKRVKSAKTPKEVQGKRLPPEEDHGRYVRKPT